MLPLPLRTEDVTVEWLTDALSSRYPGTEVTVLQVGEVIRGTATKMQLLLEYNAAGREHGLPPTMVLKGGFDIPDVGNIVGLTGYAREVEFFRDVAPELSIKIPASYFGGIDPDTGQAVVLLEDLNARGITFGRATSPITLDVAALALDDMALYHALWWESPRLDPLARFPGVLEPIILYLLGPENWAACMERPRAAAVTGELRDHDRVLAAVQMMWERNKEAPRCFIHGDPHLGNMYFEPDGSPGFLDWQGAMCGTWAHDVTYFLIGSLDIDDRRANERSLLEHYLERLAAYGAPVPGFDDAWLAYRRNVMHGFMWVVNPEELQPEDVNTACATRFATAAIDLESLASLA
ncbi:MAG TPA: phosphotransferase [Actinomycetota bacterium]|nr:phosphotransferase [Actinomycetota bacterium]